MEKRGSQVSEEGEKNDRGVNNNEGINTQPDDKEMELLRRENDYMDHLLQKVKNVF